MKITVVIPTLDEEGSIGECLDRLRHQTKNGDEIIVVDGGSSDKTIEIANSKGATTILAEGSSIGLARHIGAKKADTEIVATTDADALPPDGWVERIRSHFKQDDELSVLWGNIQDKNGKPIRNLVGKFSTLVGGASGNNTAYRKEHYEQIEDVYPDINFAEDFVAIAKLGYHGKAVRDKDLIMVMDMDRDRYQKKPIIGMGAALAALGQVTDSKYSDIAKGAGVGMIGTELTYEEGTGTPLHHDQVGAGVFTLGRKKGMDKLSGVGAGIFAHHLATEGLSAMPTLLQRGTEKVVGG